jgi:hypothetical protein
MTHEEFVSNMEAGYGKYSLYMKVKLYDYILEKYNESNLIYLEKIVLENYSTKWKTPPDIAVIKEITDNDNKSIPFNPFPIGKGNKEYIKLLESKRMKEIGNDNKNND